MDIYKMIVEERKRQDTKWGIQNHNQEKWITILGEEFGEVCKATLEHSDYEYIKEMTQVAAVAVAALESWFRNNNCFLIQMMT